MASSTDTETREIDIATRLAYERTRLAYENTMMAWVRTATSLITFGFSVYKFFQFETRGAEHVDPLVTPRGFALLMITFGLVSLLAGTIQHVTSLQHLRSLYPPLPRSIASILAGLISLLGLLVVIVVLFRH